MNSIVNIEALTKVYPKSSIVTLHNIDLVVEEGEFLSILGPSGSGKTTLLNIIGALDKPTSGSLIVDGVDLVRVGNLDSFRAKRIGFVFQLHNLIPMLDAWENVQLPMYSLNVRPEQRKQRALELLEIVGLKDRIHHKPTMLSGGERQRVALARALANSPRLVLADEPTGTLDPAAGDNVIKLMQRLNRENGITFIVVTHDQKMAAAASRVVHIVDGNVLEMSRVSAPVKHQWNVLVA